MIKRYSREEISKIWELENKFSYYLDVEIAVVKAQVELGNFPEECYEVIKNNAKFDVQRIDEIEQIVRHDVIAFLQNVNENVPDEFLSGEYSGLQNTVETLVIGDNVETIGNRAFYNLYNVKELTIGNNVKSIGAYAFCKTFLDYIIPIRYNPCIIINL